MLSKFFLNRPVFAWVIAIIIMSVGIIAIYNLPISQYPQMAPPTISISSSYPGASSETVENSVTQVIEQKMTGLDRLLYMSASSDSAALSLVILDVDHFKLYNDRYGHLAGDSCLRRTVCGRTS